MSFLSAKKLFKDKKYDELILLSKNGNLDLSSVSLFLNSVVSYEYNILYSEEEKNKAKELKIIIDKLQFTVPDEFRD